MSELKPKRPYEPPAKRNYVHVKEVAADPTMTFWDQILRFEIEARRPPIANVVLDRVHRVHPSQSKPTAWLHFSDPGQLITIAVGALATATAMSLYDKEHASVEDLISDVKKNLEEIWELSRVGALQTAKWALAELQAKLKR